MVNELILRSISWEDEEEKCARVCSLCIYFFFFFCIFLFRKKSLLTGELLFTTISFLSFFIYFFSFLFYFFSSIVVSMVIFFQTCASRNDQKNERNTPSGFDNIFREIDNDRYKRQSKIVARRSRVYMSL